MQQTQNLKLNLIETGDPLSPLPLNENAEKLDAALTDVSRRVIQLEGCRIIVGVYQRFSSADSQIIDLGGRPAAVLAAGHSVGSPHMGFVVGDQVAVQGSTTVPNLRILDNGFEVSGLLSNVEETYCFMALMGDWVSMNVPKYEAP